MAWNLGGEVQKADHREYGSADITINKLGGGGGGGGAVDALFEGLGDKMRVRSFILLSKFVFFNLNLCVIGLDVSCRSIIETTSGFSRYWIYWICTLRRYRS
jgi:hypothetical protein